MKKIGRKDQNKKDKQKMFIFEKLKLENVADERER